MSTLAFWIWGWLFTNALINASRKRHHEPETTWIQDICSLLWWPATLGEFLGKWL